MNGNSNIQTFIYTVAAGAPIVNFALGAKPARVEIFNVTSGATAVWTNTMADGSHMLVTGTSAGFVTSKGVSVLSGAVDASTGLPIADGFSLSTAMVDINDTAAEVLHITAFTAAD